MIYGCFSYKRTGLGGSLNLDTLSNLMDCHGGSIHHPEATEHFSGGIIRNTSLKLTIDDYLYRDPLNGDTLLFTGHIYNHKEIIEQLGLKDNTYPEPALLYHTYQEFGPSFVDILNGDFSIAIIIHSQNKLLLYRDHLGARPMAYTQDEKSLYFSTDILSLCRAFHSSDQKINPEPLLDNFKFIDFTQTLNTKVKKLLPGHYLEVSDGKAHIHRYWFPEKIKINRKMKREWMLRHVRELTERSVNIRCDKRYTAAAHISGGLDSGIVAALGKMACKHQDTFYGYSWSPVHADKKGIKIDEREMVQDQARMNEIETVFISTTADDYCDQNARTLHRSNFFEENLSLVDAQKRNIQILLSGHGGDEFISIGGRGLDTDLLLNFRWRSFLRRHPLNKPKALLRGLLYNVIMPYLGILPAYEKRDFDEDTQYLSEEFKQPKKENIRNFFMFRSRRKLHIGFLNCYYLPERMEMWYVNGIRHGIEYRYPLLDKDIVEFMMSVPSRIMVNGSWSRTILRDISNGLLPDSVRWKKSGADPVLFKTVDSHVYTCSKKYLDEFDVIRKNPDLYFINFDKMDSDIKKYRQEPDDKKYRALLFDMFNIKALHEYTKAYRNMILETLNQN